MHALLIQLFQQQFLRFASSSIRSIPPCWRWARAALSQSIDHILTSRGEPSRLDSPKQPTMFIGLYNNDIRPLSRLAVLVLGGYGLFAFNVWQSTYGPHQTISEAKMIQGCPGLASHRQSLIRKGNNGGTPHRSKVAAPTATEAVPGCDSRHFVEQYNNIQQHNTLETQAEFDIQYEAGGKECTFDPDVLVVDLQSLCSLVLTIYIYIYG